MAISTPTTSGQILTSAYVNNNINSGLVYVGNGSLSLTTTASNVTGVFSSTYTNYRVLLNITARSTSNRLNMRYLVGTTPTAVNYYQAGLASDYGADATAYFQRSNNDTQFFFDATTGTASYSMDIMSPQLATSTRHYGQTAQTANPLSFTFGGAQTGSLQHTGFQISCSAGTATVEYQVFGYRQA